MEISLDDAYAPKTPAENKDLYAKWAKSYESDFVKNAGYQHPKVIAEIFDNEIPILNRVIEAGTGTGLVGLHLASYRNIILDGIDISPEMLAEAREKNVYRNLYERDLTRSIEGTDAPYDALICIGIFTHGHLGTEAIQNLIPLISNNGYFVIGINAKYFTEKAFEGYFDKLESSGVITTPKFKSVHVYATDSEHHDSLNVVAIFQRA